MATTGLVSLGFDLVGGLCWVFGFRYCLILVGFGGFWFDLCFGFVGGWVWVLGFLIGLNVSVCFGCGFSYW